MRQLPTCLSRMPIYGCCHAEGRVVGSRSASRPCVRVQLLTCVPGIPGGRKDSVTSPATSALSSPISTHPPPGEPHALRTLSNDRVDVVRSWAGNVAALFEHAAPQVNPSRRFLSEIVSLLGFTTQRRAPDSRVRLWCWVTCLLACCIGGTCCMDLACRMGIEYQVGCRIVESRYFRAQFSHAC